MTLLRWLTFLIGYLIVALTVMLFWTSFFLLTLVFVLQFIVFPPKSKWDAPFHRIAYDYFVLVWTVFLIIWEMFHGRIFLNSVLLLLLKNFVSWFRLGLMYISLIVNIRPGITHLNGFQLLVLLP